ncbi:hypothetical protein, partial [Helicobacter pullorum]|uniref:hypothetical protein n=1 Tax=Helicobacter pullorum TaxID=35818 RepID=UPI0015CF1771
LEDENLKKEKEIKKVERREKRLLNEIKKIKKELEETRTTIINNVASMQENQMALKEANNAFKNVVLELKPMQEGNLEVKKEVKKIKESVNKTVSLFDKNSVGVMID